MNFRTSNAGTLPVWAATASALFATVAYLYGLGSLFAPTIGDEPFYIQIARVTAASGHFLPLRGESGVLDVKPPLLFWQGILSTGWGARWSLWHLRFPVVLTSLATAWLAGWLAARISGRRAAGVLAGLAYLGFLSSIQYGRPFLTNAGESLFLFLAFALVAVRPRLTLPLAAAAGAAMGLAMLFKSFAVLLPGGLGLALVAWRREGWSAAGLVRRNGVPLAAAAIVALAVFALWPLLDPQRELIWTQFVVEQNRGKFHADEFLSRLAWGEDSIWQIWLGPLRNAGLYAPLAAALAWDLWRRRRELPGEEAELWLWLVAFLVAYTLPTQRQANYLLPAMPAVAVLLALRWDALPAIAFRIPLALLGVGMLALPFHAARLRALVPDLALPALAVALPVAAGAVALAGAARVAIGRVAFPLLALGVLVLGSAVMEPFSRPFPAGAVEEVRGKKVYVPDRFLQSQERYRFVLPGADVRGFRCGPGPACVPPSGGERAHALLYLPLDAPLPPGWEQVASVPHPRGRHTDEQILQILGGRVDLLVERMVLARPLTLHGPQGPPPFP